MRRSLSTGKITRFGTVRPFVPVWTSKQEQRLRTTEQNSEIEETSDAKDFSEGDFSEGELKEIVLELSEEEEEEDEEDEEDEEVNEMEHEMIEKAEILRCGVFQLTDRYQFIKLLNLQDNHCFLARMQDQKVVVKFGRYERTIPKEVRILLHMKANPHIQELLAWHMLEDKMYATVSPRYKNKSVFDIEPTSEFLRLFMRQLLETIRDLHVEHIMHRDIKLANIMWDKDSFLRLIDFDTATFHRGTPHIRFVGTDGYMAPEVQKLEKNENAEGYGPGVDVFSAGVVLGQLVFKVPEEELSAEKVKKWIQRLQRKKRNRKKRCKKPVHKLLRLLLQPNPDMRPSAEQALQHSFFKDKQ